MCLYIHRFVGLVLGVAGLRGGMGRTTNWDGSRLTYVGRSVDRNSRYVSAGFWSVLEGESTFGARPSASVCIRRWDGFRVRIRERRLLRSCNVTDRQAWAVGACSAKPVWAVI